MRIPEHLIPIQWYEGYYWNPLTEELLSTKKYKDRLYSLKRSIFYENRRYGDKQSAITGYYISHKGLKRFIRIEKLRKLKGKILQIFDEDLFII